MVESVGGTLETCYFASGDNDFYVIAELPDNVNAAAGFPVAGAGGDGQGQDDGSSDTRRG
jgi:uncharacterized protein with GYD domain